MSELAAPITDLPTTLEQTARDLSTFFRRPDNADIGLDFPGTLAAFRQPLPQVVAELRGRQAIDEPGIRQYFLSYAHGENSGEDGDVLRAVGIGLVSLAEPPLHLRLETGPNISLMICNPYRKIGLGKLMVQSFLDAVDKNFDKRHHTIWTSVRRDNKASQRLVEGSGFTPYAQGVASTGQPGTFYVYNKLLHPHRD